LDITDTWQELVIPGGKIAYLVMDGLGGLASAETGRTALDSAETPNLDALARDSSCGLLEMVGPGITPGSGPGHLALFGYDPLRWRIGRGVLSALGIDFPLQPGDLAARVNFATINSAGEITDRRAGRIPSDLNQQLCAKIREALDLSFDGEVFLETESQHRAVLVLRDPDPDALSDALPDTDPQVTGRAPIPIEGQSEQARSTARVLAQFLEQAHAAIADEQPANALLLRGFQRHEPLPGLRERFGLNGLCIAEYPMYRGLSRLLGMDVAEPPSGMDGLFQAFEQHAGDAHDFYFLHVKGTDSAGEDGDLDAKVAVIEEVDRRIPWLLEQRPDVLVITGDHSTPAVMSAHSWHPVPVLLHARHARRGDAEEFNERACLKGALGLRPGFHLLGLALGHAGRMKKFGA
jgi:2,3-bisphosphoglycerate-independent phosphoglycerate mutase